MHCTVHNRITGYIFDDEQFSSHLRKVSLRRKITSFQYNSFSPIFFFFTVEISQIFLNLGDKRYNYEAIIINNYYCC